MTASDQCYNVTFPSSPSTTPNENRLGTVAPTLLFNNETDECMDCGVHFTLVKRRHHCRACGKIFCSSCTNCKSTLEYLGEKRARVCDNCFYILYKQKDASDFMGAGVVKPQPGGRGFEIHINTRGPMTRTPGQTTGSLKCEECATVFSAFKKKKHCKDCARDFCSACTVQVNGTSPRQQQCLKCQTLLSGNFTRSQISSWKVKDLKALLNHQKVNTAQCREKNELIDLVISSFSGDVNVNQRGTEEEQFVQNLRERMRLENENSQQSGSSTNRDNSNTTQTRTEPTNQTSPTETTNQTQATSDSTNPTQTTNSTNQNPSPSPANGNAAQQEAQRLQERRERELREAQARAQNTQEEEESNDSAQNNNPKLQLDDIKTEKEIECLNIKSLKRLLLNNFVDYKGCVERWELQERVKRLWQDNEVNKQKAEEQRKLSDNPSSSGSLPGALPGEEDICKICMDATIDCVLLECGHMVTCTKCGKRLAECPICRQYVVRAVHTFRS